MLMLWVFDNDGTLYNDSKIQINFGTILTNFCCSKLGCNNDEVSELIKELKLKWSTDFSIVALMKEFDLDYSELVDQTYLKVDFTCVEKEEGIEDALLSLTGQKTLFTNNPSEFAKKVLERLNVLGQFSRIIGMSEMNFVCKPNISAYELVHLLFPDYKASQICFIDDSTKNLNTARLLGWHTVLIGDQLNTEGHRKIRSLSELKDLF